MSIFLKQTDPEAKLRVDSPEAMIAAIRACGIVPFFENAIPGYSIEEMTPREYWFDGEDHWCLQTRRLPRPESVFAA